MTPARGAQDFAPTCSRSLTVDLGICFLSQPLAGPTATDRHVTQPFSHPYAAFLHKVSKPTRYTGAEHGTRRKGWAAVESRVCLAFPDVYDIGMSHLGFRILYKLLNDDPRTLAERCYAPWPDMERLLREHEMPLVALESHRPLCDFDVVGFSLQYELTYTNVLCMLDLGRIPIRSDQRQERDPLVVVGGPVATHAEPISPFFDAALIGDGEEATTQIALMWAADTRAGLPRRERLERLASIHGVYVPSLYRTEIDPESGLEVIAEPTVFRAPLPVRRRIVTDLGAFPFPATGPVGGPEAIFDRVSIEIARGCTEGCRFCQAGMIYRPVRERDPARVVDTALEALKSAGQDEVGLTALSTADVSSIAPLVKSLAARTAGDRVSLGVASLRAYGLSEDLLDEMRKVRASGLTFAPEAGSQRLRDVINKNITEEQMLETAHRVFSRGFDRIKLYFILGLPTEQDEDVLAIADMAQRTVAIGRGYTRRAKVTVSASTHVPKPHTPFQWCAMESLSEIERKQRLLRDALRGTKAIGLRFHDLNTSWLEAILARGDRRLGPVIERAYRRGARFDSWEDQLRLAEWQQALTAENIAIDALLGTLPVGARLPWDHFDVGLEPGFLGREYRKALRGRLSPPCGKAFGMLVHHARSRDAREDQRRLVCYDCGIACDLGRMRDRRIEMLETMEARFPQAAPMHSVEAHEVPAEPPAPSRLPPELYRPVQPGGPPVRWRLRYSKTGPAALLGHLDVARELPRIVRRAGVSTSYTRGFRPKPNLSFGPALALGILSLDEYLDIALVGAPDSASLLLELNRACPEGLAFTGAVELDAGDPGLCRVLSSARYVAALPANVLAEIGGGEALGDRVSSFLAQPSYVVVRQGPRGARNVDVRAACERIDLGDKGDRDLLAGAGLVSDLFPAAFELSLGPGVTARPSELLGALLGDASQQCALVRVGLLAGGLSPLDLAELRRRFSGRRGSSATGLTNDGAGASGRAEPSPVGGSVDAD